MRRGRVAAHISARPVPLQVALVSSPLGLLKAAVREGKLTALAFPAEERFLARASRRLGRRPKPTPDPGETGVQAGHSRRLPGAADSGAVSWTEPGATEAGLLTELSRQLGLYFGRLRKHFFLPLAPDGTPFQQRVWAQMQRIPYGQVRTYAELAEGLGNRRLARAVGRACAANPLPIVIPCHRVVASGGGLGGYSAGLEVKRLLLAIEGAPGFAPAKGEPARRRSPAPELA